MLKLVPRIEGSDVTVSESDLNALIKLVRSGPNIDSVSVDVTTVDGTAIG